MKSTKILAAMLILLTACGSDADVEPQPGTESAAPAAAPAAPAGQPRAVAGTEEALTYPLTMPAVRRWYDAQRNIGEVLSGDEDLIDEFESVDGVSVDALEAHYDGMPEIRRAIRQAGLEVREFALILIALPHAMSAQRDIEDGADRATVISRRQVDPANLEFVRANRAELDRLQREVEG